MALIRPADALAREHTERAISTIAEIMDDPLAEQRDRLAAAKEILDRGHGKPLTATIALPMSRQQAAALAAMTDEELDAIIQSTQLPRLQPAIEHKPRAVDPLLE
jgi:HEAT repeat protein